MNSIFFPVSGTPADERERDNMRAEIAKQNSLIDYVSMMVDVDLPEEDEEMGDDEDESEI